LNEALKKLKVCFSGTQQDRSKRTLDDLVCAATVIADGGDPSQFNARILSKVSGHSLGSLVKRLGKIENVFLYAIALGRSRQIAKINAELVGLGPNAEPKEILEKFVDLAFKGIQRVNPAVIRYYEKRAFNRCSNLADVYGYTEEIVDPLLQLIESNLTGKFRRLNYCEAKYVCRVIFLFIERPFVEGDPIAGTMAHRQMVVHNISQILSAED